MEKNGVVAFAFGAPETILSNRRIALIASRAARTFNAPVYTQVDIKLKPEIEVEYIEEKPGRPPSTLRIARGAVQWAKKNKFEVLLIVAAAPHLWRCQRDLKYAVLEAKAGIVVQVCGDEFRKDEWYCPNSTWARVRSQEAWQRRERILKLLPMFIYKVVAS